MAHETVLFALNKTIKFCKIKKKGFPELRVLHVQELTGLIHIALWKVGLGEQSFKKNADTLATTVAVINKRYWFLLQIFHVFYQHP